VRAVVLNSFTGIAGLELSEVPDPTPADGEQLVRVRAASLGPWDLANANGAFVAAGGSSEFPQVQGWDFAGETVDGRRVVGFVPQPWMGIGALAEQISVPASILTAAPDPLGFPEGSALPVCGLTARLLVDAAAVQDGDTVLVTGAAGMVGGLVVELASSRGARAVAGVRNADVDEAGQLGAEMTFGTAGGLASEVRGEWPQGLDACIDTVGLAAEGRARESRRGRRADRAHRGGPSARALPGCVWPAGARRRAREDRAHPVGRRHTRSRIHIRGTSTALS
jgi:NADPH:quinone reductase